MPRNITVTFEDGSTHVYQNAPDDVTPEQVTARASKEFGKSVSALDGGRGQQPAKGAPELLARPAETPQPQGPASPNVTATGGAGYSGPQDPRMMAAMGGGRLPRIATQNILEGAAGVGDAVVNTPNRLWNLLGMAPELISGGQLSKLTGTVPFEPTPDNMVLQNLLRRGGGLTPETGGERAAAKIGQFIGGAGAGGGINPNALGRSLMTAGGAGLGAAAANEVAPNSMLAELTGAVIGGQAGSTAAGIPGRLARLAQASGGPLPVSAETDIIRLGEQRGVPVKTSDIRPPQTKAGKLLQDTGESVPLIGSGGRVQQQAARQKAVQDALDDYGVGVGQDFRQAVAAELLKKRESLLTRFTGVKESIKDRSQGIVPTTKALQQIDDEIAKNTRVLGDQAAPANQLLADFKSVLQGKDLRTLEEGRKWLGQQLDDPSRAGIKDMLGKSKDAVYGALKSDIETHIAQTIGKPAAESWRKANNSLSSMIGEAEKTSLGNVLNKAEMTPEAIKQLLSSANPSDVARLNANLTSQGRAAARSAVVQKAFDSAFREGKFSEEAFNTALGKELKTSGAFFGAGDRAQLEGLRRLLGATQRASKVGLLPETGAKLSIPVAISGLAGALSSAAGGIATYGSIGALSRAYESAPVRNFLLRLSKLPPQQVSREAQRVIPAIVAIQQEQQ